MNGYTLRTNTPGPDDVSISVHDVQPSEIAVAYDPIGERYLITISGPMFNQFPGVNTDRPDRQMTITLELSLPGVRQLMDRLVTAHIPGV